MLSSKFYKIGALIAFVATTLCCTQSALPMTAQPAQQPQEEEFITLNAKRIEQKNVDWQKTSLYNRLNGVAFMAPGAILVLCGLGLLVWYFIKSNEKVSQKAIDQNSITTEEKINTIYDEIISTNNGNNLSWWSWIKNLITKDLAGPLIIAALFSIGSGIVAIIWGLAKKGVGHLFTGLGKKDLLTCIQSFINNVDAYQKALTIFAISQKKEVAAGSIEEKIDIYGTRNFLANHRAFVESTESILGLLDILLKKSSLNRQQHLFFDQSLQAVHALINDFITTTVRPIVNKKATLNADQIESISQKFAYELKHFINVSYGALYEKTNTTQTTA